MRLTYVLPPILALVLCTASVNTKADADSKHPDAKIIVHSAAINQTYPVSDPVFINTPYTGWQTVSFTRQSGITAGTYRLAATNGQISITGLQLRTNEPTQYDVLITSKSGATVSKKVLVLP